MVSSRRVILPLRMEKAFTSGGSAPRLTMRYAASGHWATSTSVREEGRALDVAVVDGGDCVLRVVDGERLLNLIEDPQQILSVDVVEVRTRLAIDGRIESFDVPVDPAKDAAGPRSAALPERARRAD